MSDFKVEKIVSERSRDLELTPLNGSSVGLDRRVHNAELHRPGLALAGFFERFANRRVQILGETEMAYMTQLADDQLKDTAEKLFVSGVPMVLISKGLAPPPVFLDVARAHNTAVYSSRLTTAVLSARLSAYLDNLFAPTTNVHGTLIDVYGVGLLYTGKSGIGKSEVALDLVERGHRLVADDVVRISKVAPDVLIGTGSELLGHHMEIRGVGIIDIEELFGIRAIRLQKRIEVEVRLTLWEDTESYERLGVDDKYTAVLGVQIPILYIPISPGKNITVISEVIAMNHMLKVYGENSALEFSKKLSQRLSRQSTTRDYLESDYE
ncbi:MAG: HPr(Ser) kinase/phosphatase [Candidatus Zixiibacteriota bacterium]|nr:MAG: HPr(Ser) kinase/phosphatase [candidate division Zixibacteria bacterium]